MHAQRSMQSNCVPPRRVDTCLVSAERITRLLASLTVLMCLSPLAGFRAAAFAGVDGPGEISVGGLQRTYYLHVPAGLDHPSGLVLNLHGAGATGGAQAAATGYNGVADAHGFVVAYPDGIDLSWADGRGASVPDRQGVDDVGFLSALAGQLMADYAIPPGRVFATGMSAGAFMVNRLACERADLVAAIAPVAGTLGSAFPCNPSQPVSVLQVHGTSDPVVPFGGGLMVGRGGLSDIVSAPALAQRWRDVDGCPPPSEISPNNGVHQFTAAGCRGGTEVDFVQIDGGGHTWPGWGSPFDVSQAGAQFFAAHGR